MLSHTQDTFSVNLNYCRAIQSGAMAADFGPHLPYKGSPLYPRRPRLTVAPDALLCHARPPFDLRCLMSLLLFSPYIPETSVTHAHRLLSSVPTLSLHSVHSHSTPSYSDRGTGDAGMGMNTGVGPLPGFREQNIIAPSWTCSPDGVWQPSLPSAAPSLKVHLVSLIE